MLKVKSESLDNKIRTLVVSQKDSQTATFTLMINVGSRNETLTQKGMAHFVEHMMFKGTKNRPTSRELVMEMEKIGGSSNAFTSKDYTVYYIKVPSQNIYKAIDIFADILENHVFEEEETQKESGVIVEEIKMYEDRPSNKVSNIWYTSHFGENHQLGWDIAGNVDSVKAMTSKDLYSFVKKNYQPQNIVISVAGGVNEEKMSEYLAGKFEDYGTDEAQEFAENTKSRIPKRFRHIRKVVEQTHIALGCEGVDYDYKKDYELDMVDVILSKGFGSRLFHQIREELGLAYYVYGNNNNFSDTGIYRIGMGVSNDRYMEAVDAVLAEIHYLVSGQFTDEELERAKNYLLGSLSTDLEGSDDLAIWHGMQLLHKPTMDSVEYAIERIQSTSREDVIEVAKDVFENKEATVTVISPHDKLDSKLENITFA